MAISKAEILDAISSMSVLDLSALIKEMEEKFGVSAAAVAVAAGSSSRQVQLQQQQVSKLSSA
jgi:large subunit ribosomal protein L7/L12